MFLPKCSSDDGVEHEITTEDFSSSLTGNVFVCYTFGEDSAITLARLLNIIARALSRWLLSYI